jgi:Uma2 family endonuclease
MKQPVRKPLSFDELEALEDATGQRHELWHGEPIAMTGGTLKHNLIALESLAAYLILSQQEMLVDVYQRVQSWQCEHYQGLNGEIRLAALDLRLPLREAYADVFIG